MKKTIVSISMIWLLSGCQSGLARIGANDINNAIQRGQDLNKIDSDGNILLNFEAAFHHIDNIKLLLKNGADINARDSDGGTVLQAALFLSKKREKALSIVQFLVESGADVNAKDNDGQTALHTACFLSEKLDIFEVTKYLTSKGASLKAKDKEGKSAWEDCKENPKVFEYFKDRL